MKLLYTFLGIAVLALAGISFYYTNIRKEDTSFKVATSTPKTELIYIYREYGDVAFKNKSATSFTQVTDSKMTISNFATVKTGDGRGYVIFPDNSSIALSTSTEIEISYEPTKTSIMQLLGSTYHRVTSLASGNKYEVRTPNTLAAVRGTKFAVTYNLKSKKTYVAVTHHQVEVTPTKADGTVDKAPVMVQEGSVADVQTSTTTSKASTTTQQTNEKMVIRTNDEVREMKTFIEENKVIDKELDKTSPENNTELIEKIINSLQKEPAVTSTTTSATPAKKPETRTDTLTRVVKQVTTKTPLTNPVITPQVKEIPTTPEPPVKTGTVTPLETTLPKTTEVKTLKELPTNIEEFTPEQEAFIDSFYTVYEKYFSVDEPMAYCKRLGTTSSKSMMTLLLDITNKSGYILPKQTELTTFAIDLVNACADGSMQSKASSFKTRFDTTYPY